QQMCCNNKSSKRAGAGVAVCIAVAAVIIIIIIVTLSVLLTMPSGNSSTNATSLNDTNMTTIPSTDAAPTLTSQRSHTPVLTSTAPTATSQFSKIPVVTGTTPGLTSKISQTTISTSTETTLPSELSETTISTSTLPPYTSQLSRTTISSSTPPTYTSELSQTTISKSTPPTFTSELSETTISTDTAPTHTSQLSQTSVSTVLTPMLPATIPSVTFLPHTTQSRTTIPLPTVPRTSSFFSTLLGETTQSRTTIGLPTVPRITTTGPTAIPITQSPCNVLTVDENSRIEVLEPIPTMSAVTACIWAQTDEVSGGTPFSYNTAGADNEFFLSFPENFRVGIRGATTGATGISVNDGAWHHVCVTWNSVGGIFNIYDNGVLAFGGSSFRTGLMIRSGGVLILGQEQDTLGGGFDPGQAFKGDLANFNMWNRELDGVDILHSTNDCSCDIEGNVFSWKSDSLDIAGTALVSAEDFCPKPSLTNVALDKTATQSSDWSVSFPASNAVDGNTNTHWGSGSCTSTQRDVNAWWKVDLGENYLVYEVILTNRQDPCCKTRILNSEVRIGLSDVISENIRCGELVALEQTSQSDVVFECDSPIVGRYASLQLVDRTDLLNFCEMRVMALGKRRS
uniref:Cell wall protein AWA1-like n=1 Tax=Saccoglossus kowalevskii TaxID=10224 RepID=A0ABM0LU11_SACKO